MKVLFCSDPLDPRRPDTSFAEEAAAVRDVGLACALVDHDALVAGDVRAAVRRVPPAAGAGDADHELAVYRGWMLRPGAYRRLFDGLAGRGVRLINDPDAYLHAHHLPGWYPALEGHTPRSVWMPMEARLEKAAEIPVDEVLALLRSFGDSPLILKDYVKSRKHEWAEACFIPRASDRAAVERVVRRFVELQDVDLEGGLVFRERADLVPAGVHPKSGMPLSREFRLFFLDGEPIASLHYWDEGDRSGAPPPMEDLRGLAARIKSRFFTMDVAELRGGGWTIIEVGDAQVSGLPAHADRRAFYGELGARLGGRAPRSGTG